MPFMSYQVNHSAALIRATHAADESFRIARRRLAEIEQEWERHLGEDPLVELAKMLDQLDEWQEARKAAQREVANG